MRALVQRADGAQVAVGDRVLGAFEGAGLVVLVGVTHSDGPEQARRLAAKVHGLRLFEADRYRGAGRCLPPGGPRELSAADLGLPLLVISQFTLYGETRKGRRPTWEAAAPREQAEPLVAAVAAALRAAGAPVSTGVFGADMRLRLVNDGPVTVLVEV